LALKGCGFQGNSVDPCLWTKYTEHGIEFVGIYVDDCLVIDNEKDINDVIDGLKTHKFGLKIANDLEDFLSCRILTDYERKICDATSFNQQSKRKIRKIIQQFK
jgi:hypothetical protein